jgi:hypothetical protein
MQGKYNPRMFRMNLLAIRLCLTISVCGFPLCVWAQDFPVTEVGPTLAFTSVRYNNIGHTCCDSQEIGAGFGGRALVNFSELFGAQVQFATFPKTYYGSGETRPFFLSGDMKITARNELTSQVNVFGLVGVGTSKTPRSSGSGVTASNVAEQVSMFNLGGGIEIVAVRELSIRFDLADSVRVFPEKGSLPAVVKHGPLLQVSAMFRFFH